MSKKNLSWLTNTPIAHRGLHSNEQMMPENSISAFRNAARQGFAIELDIFMNRKRELLIFHDESLMRMCKYDRSIFAYDADNEEHRKFYKLLNSQESIPRLTEVLDAVDKQVPVIIHIREIRFKEKKLFGRKKVSYKEIYEVLYQTLAKYKDQEIAIQSFDPFLLGLFARKLPQVIRGQLSSDFRNEKLSWLSKYLLSNYKLNWYSRPDYLAHDFNALTRPDKFLQAKRKKGMPVLCWTILNAEDHQKAVKSFDNIIFERFIPK